MSVPFDQHNEFSDRTATPEIVGGAAFVPGTGRIYRLFGNEEEPFSIPEIPPLPPICAALQKPAVSLEEALQQIDTFFSTAADVPEENEVVQEPENNAPTLQLLQVLGETAPPVLVSKAQGLQSTQNTVIPTEAEIQTCGSKPCSLDSGLRRNDGKNDFAILPVNKEGVPANNVLPARAIINEVLQTSPQPKKEKRQPLRVVSEAVEEPFIVPFVKPVSEAREKPEESETKSPALKIATEFTPPVLLSKTFQKYWFLRRKERTLYLKPCLPVPIRVPQTVELPAVIRPKPNIDTSAFCWSPQLGSLMQTANNQIRMLTDHLVVQANQGIKGICFKGVFPGDGCSTIALCAARALTERGYHVLLIDAHHRHVDLPNQLNLSGNLDSENEVLALDARLGLWVWQESKTEEENRRLLSEVVAVHREKYDLILLDDGSVTESPMSRFVEFWDSVELDGVILVANTKRPTEMPVSHIAGRFRQHCIPLIGITENYV